MQNMGIEEVKTVPQSPWQNPYCERVIGSIRRDCLDHIIVLNENHLKGILSDYFEYYHRDRTHLGLSKDTPYKRQIQLEPENGMLISLPRIGGIHHKKAGFLPNQEGKSVLAHCDRAVGCSSGCKVHRYHKQLLVLQSART
ncbi:MAG: integrase core domain-containing protein [Nitrospinales bacterium]